MPETISINMFLIILIAVMAFTQKGKGRVSAVSYGVALLSFALFLSCDDGAVEYKNAALIDLVILLILCFLTPVSRISDVLISLSLASGAINFFGWAMWNNGYSNAPYEYACLMIYVIAILSMLRNDGAYESGLRTFNHLFRHIGRPGYALRCILRQETR